MFARVARWEDGDSGAIRRAAEELSSGVAESGLPEDVPAKSFLLLIDPENQRQIAISLFDSEEDLRKGDEVLNSMNPPVEGIGRRLPVEMYEVAVEVRD